MFKLLNKRRKKGQSTLEYAILIIIIIGALVSIQVYIKRGVQGRLKSAADDIGEQFSVGNSNYVKTTTVITHTNEKNLAGTANSYLLESENTYTNVTSEVMNLKFEYWGG